MSIFLKFPSGRVEYQSKPSFSGVSSFKHLLARLPPRVHSAYYRDEIGNISSSHLRTDPRKVTCDLMFYSPIVEDCLKYLSIGYLFSLYD
jgi:oligosaccharyltransferase complex subunit alpha (ribophorin I)